MNKLELAAGQSLEAAVFAWFLGQKEIDSLFIERSGARLDSTLPIVRVQLTWNGISVSRYWMLASLAAYRFPEDIRFLVERDLNEAVASWRRNRGSFGQLPEGSLDGPESGR